MTLDKTYALKDNLLAVKARKIRAVLAGNHPEVDYLLDRINHTITQPITVAIMGEFSAGKSSFLNKLLGIDALPVSVLPKTATLTRLVYGTEAAVEVEYDFDGEVIIKRHEGYDVFSELQRAAKVNDPVFIEELERISEVRVFVKNSILTKLNLLDTPGFNHDQSMDDKSINALANTDIVIWIGDYNQLGKKTEFEKLTAIKEKIKHLYLIINKADVHISDSEAYQKAQGELACNLSENDFLKFFKTDDIHLISSKATDSFWDGKFQQFLAHFSEAILNADLKISLSLIEEKVSRLEVLLTDESHRYTTLQDRLVFFETQHDVGFSVSQGETSFLSSVSDASRNLSLSLEAYCVKCAKLNNDMIFSVNSFAADFLKKDLNDQFTTLQHDYGIYLNEWQHNYRTGLLKALEKIVVYLPCNHQSSVDRINILIAYFQLACLGESESDQYYLPATDRTVDMLRLIGINHFTTNGLRKPINWKMKLNVLSDGILNISESTKKQPFIRYIQKNIGVSIQDDYESDISRFISNQVVKGIITDLNSICHTSKKQLDEALNIMSE